MVLMMLLLMMRMIISFACNHDVYDDADNDCDDDDDDYVDVCSGSSIYVFDKQVGLDEGGYLRLIASDSVNGHWQLDHLTFDQVLYEPIFGFLVLIPSAISNLNLKFSKSSSSPFRRVSPDPGYSRPRIAAV